MAQELTTCLVNVAGLGFRVVNVAILGYMAI